MGYILDNHRYLAVGLNPPCLSSNPGYLLFSSRLALYVYEYLLHVGAQKSAQTFLSEVRPRLRRDKQLMASGSETHAARASLLTHERGAGSASLAAAAHTATPRYGGCLQPPLVVSANRLNTVTERAAWHQSFRGKSSNVSPRSSATRLAAVNLPDKTTDALCLETEASDRAASKTCRNDKERKDESRRKREAERCPSSRRRALTVLDRLIICS